MAFVPVVRLVAPVVVAVPSVDEAVLPVASELSPVDYVEMRQPLPLVDYVEVGQPLPLVDRVAVGQPVPRVDWSLALPVD